MQFFAHSRRYFFIIIHAFLDCNTFLTFRQKIERETDHAEHSKKKKDSCKSIEDLSAATALHNQRKKVKNIFSGFFRTVYLVLIAFAISYVPVISMDTWTGYYTLFKKTAAPNLPRFLYFLAHSPLFFNCAVNAFLFLRRDEEVSKLYSNIFLRKSTNTDIEVLRGRRNLLI